MEEKRIKSWFYIVFLSALIWLLSYRDGNQTLFTAYSSIVCCLLIFTNTFFVFFALCYKDFKYWNISINIIWLVNLSLINLTLGFIMTFLIAFVTLLNLKFFKEYLVNKTIQSPISFAYSNSNLPNNIVTIISIMSVIIWLIQS
jgi:hypothetical protein